MNTFVRAIAGFKSNDLKYQDTDSLDIENKQSDNLKEAGLFGESLLESKNDNKDGGVLDDLILAPKIKFCLTFDEYGNIDKSRKNIKD